jgi:hypothetical protein
VVPSSVSQPAANNHHARVQIKAHVLIKMWSAVRKEKGGGTFKAGGARMPCRYPKPAARRSQA